MLVNICANACVNVCEHVWMFVYICVDVCVNVYICMTVCVNVCVHVWILADVWMFVAMCEYYKKNCNLLANQLIVWERPVHNCHSHRLRIRELLLTGVIDLHVNASTCKVTRVSWVKVTDKHLALWLGKIGWCELEAKCDVTVAAVGFKSYMPCPWLAAERGSVYQQALKSTE